MLITTNVRGRFSYDAGKSRLLPAETMPVRGKKALMSMYFFVAKSNNETPPGVLLPPGYSFIRQFNR